MPFTVPVHVSQGREPPIIDQRESNAIMPIEEFHPREW